MANVNQHESDMAALAMKGQRYEEAASIYQNIIRTAPTPGNWLGFGYAKIALIYQEKATSDEVVYCFKKAAEASPSQRQQIEIYYAAASLKIMSDLAAYCENCLQQTKHQKRNMLLGGVTAGIGATVGLSNKNTLFTNVIGIAGVAGGAAAMYGANSKINEIRFGYEKAIKIYNELYFSCKNFIQDNSEHARQFEEQHRALKNAFQSISGRAPHRGTLILVLGILGIFCLGPFTAIPAWIMGYSDLQRMEAGSMDPGGQNLTNIGKILGIVGCILWGVILIGKMAQ